MPMPSKAPETPEEAKKSAFQLARIWGEHSLPPTLTATLIFAQHAKPFQTLPMLFPPVLLFSSYLNLQGYKTDAAGLTSAWSAAYIVLARRRKQAFSSKWSARGLVRGATMGLCLLNVLSGGFVYAFGEKKKDPEELV